MSGRILLRLIISVMQLASCAATFCSPFSLSGSATKDCTFTGCPGEIVTAQDCPGTAGTQCTGSTKFDLYSLSGTFLSTSSSCTTSATCSKLTYVLTSGDCTTSYTLRQSCATGSCSGTTAVSKATASPSPVPTSMPTPSGVIASFNFTGHVQNFTVPSGYKKLQIDAYGAKGGDAGSSGCGYGCAQLNAGGLGGFISAVIDVKENQVLYIFVGEAGGLIVQGDGTGTRRTFNGGGKGGGYAYNDQVPGNPLYYSVNGYNGNGGGGTDIRSDVSDLSTRLVVAGGGGGGSYDAGGGAGGGDIGGTGNGCNTALGGTQTYGGYTTVAASSCGSAQNAGFGFGSDGSGGGGGGGGWYGGAGNAGPSSGAGGSSYSSGKILQNLQGVDSFTPFHHGILYIRVAWEGPSFMPTKSPTASPTKQPTPIPSPKPTPSPTTPSPTNPTAPPTPLPSAVPTHVPTGSPSSQPSAALQARISINATQQLQCNTGACASGFQPSGSYRVAFQTAVASQVHGLHASDVNIYNVANARRALRSGPAVADLGMELQSISILVSYTVSFSSTQLGSSPGAHTSASVFSSAVINSLQASVTSGAFSTALVAALPNNVGITASTSAPVFFGVVSAVTRSSKPTGTPTSAPSRNHCPAGYRHDASDPGCTVCPAGSSSPYDSHSCSICPVGSFSAFPGASVCMPCALGWISTTASSTACYSCAPPAYTAKPGSSSCSSLCICLDSTRLVIVGVGLSLFFVFGAFLSGERALSLITFTVLPALDSISNALYLLQTNFYSPLLFALVIIFHFLPDLVLVYRMHLYQALFPSFHIPRPQFMTDSSFFWLGWDKGYPTYFGKRMSCTFERHDTLMKVASFWLVWIVTAVAQGVCALAYVLLHAPYVALHVPFWFIWALIGCYCYQVKAMAIGKVWSGWFRVWLNSKKMDSDVLVDTEIMNQSIFAAFVAETLPQLCLQSINNQLMGQWGALAVFSTVFSVFMVVNGCYRYLYYTTFLGVKFEDIPLELTVGFTTIKLERASHQYSFVASQTLIATAVADNEEDLATSIGFADIYAGESSEVAQGETDGERIGDGSTVELVERTHDDHIPSSSPPVPMLAKGPAPLLKALGSSIVRAAGVVHEEELHSLLSAMETRVDGRVDALEAEIQTVKTALTSELMSVKNALAKLSKS